MSEIRVDKLKGENGSSTVELTTENIPSGKTVVMLVLTLPSEI